MRVLMLGWEFPPFISGGLGTACYGLTRAMSSMGVEILFVLPKHVDEDYTSHVRLLSPAAPVPRHTQAPGSPAHPGHHTPPTTPKATAQERHDQVSFKITPQWLAGPYQTPKTYERTIEEQQRIARIKAGLPVDPNDPTAPQDPAHLQPGAPLSQPAPPPTLPPDDEDYGGDVIQQAQRYARNALALAGHLDFDVIHAHDWMTYPAGLELAALSGKPLVIHVHSTEFDRAGENIHQLIYDIERRGMHGAIRVVCVSHLTRKICEHRYGVEPDKLHVCYNGIDTEDKPLAHEPTAIHRDDKIVLFLGRLTFQKGPEFFVAAAKKVLDKYPQAKFVIAGSGDMAVQVIELAAEMGIGHKVLFTGFLRGSDVERVFKMASVYVMPSVSEPFGIAPLEAIRHDVPVIISKNSGVAEVIHHALKVDFWDVDEMANMIIAVLKHPSLGQTLREGADMEVRTLTWEGAAKKCIDIYDQAARQMDDTLPPATRPLSPTS